MTLQSDLEAARDDIVADAAKFKGIVNGPASGAGSTVSTDNGDVKSVAKAVADLDAQYASDNTLATAQGYVTDAQAWAENPEDSAVQPGEYSALHHAAKAAASAAGAATSATDAANSATAAQAAAAGIKWKNSVKASTTANITLSGEQTIDGVALVTGDRCLVQDQTAPEENGVYVVAATAWARAADMDAWDEIPSAAVLVEQGTVNGDMPFICTSDQGGTLDTTAIVWSPLAPQAIADEATLTKTGSTISVNLANPNTWTGPQRAATLADNDGSFDVSAKQNFECTPAAAITFQFSGEASAAGQTGVVYLDNSGGHAITKGAECEADADFEAIVSASGKYLVGYYVKLDGATVVLSNTGALS